MEYKTQKQRDFEKLYIKMKNDIYKVAMYYAKNPQVAEEVMQAAFYKMFIHYDKIRPETVRSYIVRTIRNDVYNWQKYGFRDLFFESNKIIGFHINEDRSAEEYCMDNLRREEARALSEEILTALKKKNSSWYEAIVMAYIFELSQDELAEMLGISKVVLQSRIYRAKKWVRNRYRDKYDEIYKPV